MTIVSFQGGPITHRYLMNKSKTDLARMYMELLEVRNRENDMNDAMLKTQCEERNRLLSALTPSAATKAAYMGEVETDVIGRQERTSVDWTAIKAIMALIRRQAGV